MRGQRGHTLMEVTIVVVVLAIIAVAAVPTYRRSTEQTRVDGCAAALRSVWSAQRAYWLEKRSYAADFDALRNEGLLDAGATTAGAFDMEMTDASMTTFVATATRVNGAWSGSLTVDQTGVVSGVTRNEEDDVVVPSAK